VGPVITVERHVHADPARVWGFVGRVADWAELLPTIDEVAPEPGADPPAVGSRYAIRQPGLARLVYEVTEWVPGHRFTWVAVAGGVRTVATHAVSPAPEGSRLLLTVDWTGPLGWLVGLVFTRRTRRYVRLEAQTFAQLAEGTGG
jgi:Polyketide cyclase / dehydrase and lipid transport